MGSAKSVLFASIMKQPGIRIETLNLAVGDMLWVAEHRVTKRRYVLNCIIERKKVSDLIDSIKDNRYREQRVRLKQTCLDRVIYLVEGKIMGEGNAGYQRPTHNAGWGGGGGGEAGGGGAGGGAGGGGGKHPGYHNLNYLIDTGAVNTALATLDTVYNFNVVNTASTSATIDFLINMHQEVQQWYLRRDITMPELGAGIEGEGEELDTFQDRLTRTSGHTIRTLFGCQLRQIRGCSVDIVAGILAKYHTLSDLLKALEDAGPMAGRRLLAEVPCGPGRKVGATIADRVYQVLCNDVYLCENNEKGS